MILLSVSIAYTINTYRRIKRNSVHQIFHDTCCYLMIIRLAPGIEIKQFAACQCDTRRTVYGKARILYALGVSVAGAAAFVFGCTGAAPGAA